MATVIKSEEREFQENSGRIDYFRLLTDASRLNKGVNPDNLNFDIRQLNPGEYCSAYHFHRYAEELFMIISVTATLRTPQGLEMVNAGDLVFFEKGESGAHQLYNHTETPCVYLDIRTFIGYDVCEYPDSNKVYLIPSGEIFNKDSEMEYFDGEKNIKERWDTLIYEIRKGEKTDYSQLMTVWESSVKATHHFLKPEDFEFYKKRIPDYFSNVDLYVIRSEETINAFMGVSGDNLEMLFVSADSREKGYGKSLLMYALNELNVKKVDVNEQNTQAVGFYERFGFKVIGHSEKDSMGKNYPILHLSL